MKSSGVTKKLIEDAAVGRGRPKYVGVGECYFIPSGSELGAYYIVIYQERKGWSCECRAFRFSSRQDGACGHIDDASQLRRGKDKSNKTRVSNVQGVTAKS